MSMKRSSAETTISSKLTSLQTRVSESFRGLEKTVVIEIVRTLDFISTLELIGAPLSKEQVESDYYARCGAGAALEPFLKTSETDIDGVPWQRSTQWASSYFYSYLVECGKLVDLLRIARMEQYGLAAAESSTGRIDIHVRSDARERYARALSKSVWRPSTSGTFSPVPDSMLARMSNYVDVDDSFFIRYDNDWEIVEEYNKRAKQYAMGFPEAEALPDEFIIGGRRFSEWKQCCEQALGRILFHIDFSLLLCKKHPETPLRDVLTMFSRKEDMAGIWLQAGLQPDAVEPTMRALTLRSEDLGGWLEAFELPTSFYIGLGVDFVLLPSFGTLENPYFSLFRHLRSVYRADWDRGVEQRESMFRSDLAKLFSAERFLVPSHGYKLRRTDGSLITDVDAVICDKETGRLSLVQLKWHDVYGRSLSERESRRKNLAHACQWIERLQHWIDDRGSDQIANALNLNFTGCDAAPEIYVIARYSAHFDGDVREDMGATWLSWSELVALKDQCSESDPLAEISAFARKAFNTPDDVESFSFKHEFPDLIVSVRVGE